MSTERDLTAQTRIVRPSRQIAPTSKLTDVNNIAQPELSFQRRAVQAFRTRAEDSLDPPVVTPNRSKASSSKQKVPATADTDTNCPTASSSRQNAPAIANSDAAVTHVDLINSSGDEDELTSSMPIFRHHNLSYLLQNGLAAKAVQKQGVIPKTSGYLKRKRLNNTDEEADIQDGEPGMGVSKYTLVLSESSCS